MIYFLLLIIAVLLCLLVWLRNRHVNLLTYTRHSDTQRLALVAEMERLESELSDLKETEEFITYTLHGRR